MNKTVNLYLTKHGSMQTRYVFTENNQVFLKKENNHSQQSAVWAPVQFQWVPVNGQWQPKHIVWTCQKANQNSIKMKTKLFIGFIILSFGFLTSCDHDTIRATGEVTSLEYSIPDFSELEISDAFNAYVTFSDTEESIRIEANDNLHDKIVVKREGNALVIGLKKFTSIRGNATLNAYIVTKKILTFDISGAARVTLENAWVESDARIDLSGASDFMGEIAAERLYLDLAGASNLDLYGNTAFLNAKLSGSSEIHDYDLEVENLKMELSGASEAFLTVTETIDIRASGASVLNYKGNATVNNKKLSGTSEIRNRN